MTGKVMEICCDYPDVFREAESRLLEYVRRIESLEAINNQSGKVINDLFERVKTLEDDNRNITIALNVLIRRVVALEGTKPAAIEPDKTPEHVHRFAVPENAPYWTQDQRDRHCEHCGKFSAYIRKKDGSKVCYNCGDDERKYPGVVQKKSKPQEVVIPFEEEPMETTLLTPTGVLFG